MKKCVSLVLAITMCFCVTTQMVSASTLNALSGVVENEKDKDIEIISVDMSDDLTPISELTAQDERIKKELDDVFYGEVSFEDLYEISGSNSLESASTRASIADLAVADLYTSTTEPFP